MLNETNEWKKEEKTEDTRVDMSNIFMLCFDENWKKRKIFLPKSGEIGVCVFVIA